MRARIINLTGLLFVAFLITGCDTLKAAGPAYSIDSARQGVAANCPVGTGPMSAGASTAVDHNEDGYGCTRIGLSIEGDSMLFEVDNDALREEPTTRRDPVWDALYTGM